MHHGRYAAALPAAFAVVIAFAQDIASPRERAGAVTYGERCSVCHGVRLTKADAAYDLATPAARMSESEFAHASKTTRGAMPSFATLLSDAQLAEVGSYVRRGHSRDLDNVPMESGH